MIYFLTEPRSEVTTGLNFHSSSESFELISRFKKILLIYISHQLIDLCDLLLTASRKLIQDNRKQKALSSSCITPVMWRETKVKGVCVCVVVFTGL